MDDDSLFLLFLPKQEEKISREEAKRGKKE
jgi:hypothetical protein